MEIHRPKPFHGWRELAKEVGVITIGIAIAIGGERLVEWLHWQHEVREAREAIAQDERGSVFFIGQLHRGSICLAERLQELDAILETASGEARLPPIGGLVGPPAPPWGFRAWQRVVSGGVLPHMRRDEVELFANEALAIDHLQRLTNEQWDDWAILRTMTGPGRRLGDAEAASLRAALARAWRHAALTRTATDALGAVVVESRLLSRSEIDASWRGGFATPSEICTPLSQVATARPEATFLSRPVGPPTQTLKQLFGVLPGADR